ncbi:glycoside hydrolase family 13 protein [Kineococcus sp. SYSU DK003]|uniref:glycoside hydrolase family 13 protein n=1 Tax=Kineococcus sp. SYSU DK003 TaxID=3383124 RepID=UPI003D7DE766
MTASPVPWWRSAAIYQVLPRSFADGDGDGVGDLAGLRARLPSLAALGVDAVWINPWYPSPLVDNGYDVTDFRDVDAALGGLPAAEEFLREARGLGLKVLLDIVPNHTADDHAWFRAALAGDERARARYLFRPGRGRDGELPPNDWESCFGGPSWTRTTNPDGTPGPWYLHSFAPGQPDLDWRNPEVREEFVEVLRFWFDRGVDGFRVDVAHGLVKQDGLPDALGRDRRTEEHPGWDQDEVHEVYRQWRQVADSYDPPRVFVAEAWVARRERLPMYLRPDELHMAFEFDPLHVAWREGPWRRVVERGLAVAELTGAPSAWALTNHDVVRQVTRYARSQPPEHGSNVSERARWGSEVPDYALGRRRARAAFLLTAALPGLVYVFNGEELGLEEVEDIPAERRLDPIHHRSGGVDPGRDGSRVPLPWSGERPPFGFSPPGAPEPWLPQPAAWAALTYAAQDDDPDSTLNLYRAALAGRRELLAGAGPLVWREAPDGVLAFDRGTTSVWVNFGPHDVALPPGAEVLLRSAAGAEGVLAVDTAVWFGPGRDVPAG